MKTFNPNSLALGTG